MKKRITITSILIAALFITSCKKEKCYQCKVRDVYTYWAKGNDTIKSIAGSVGIIPGYPTASGYEEIRKEYVWAPYYITRCGDKILYIQEDSCHFIN